MARTALVRTDRYSWGAIWLHWTIAVLVLANLTLGLFHDSLLDGVRWAMPVHQAIGITVLALTAMRIAWRSLRRPPPLPPGTPGWQRRAAAAVHAIFYLLLVALPLSGWILSSDPARPRAMTWFGLLPVPPLPVPSAAAGLGHDTHMALGYLMAALVAIHIAAALRHHVLLRDAVLGRMAPYLIRNG